MKKLLNVMLATFLVFTVISFAVSAEDGATNEGSVAVATGNEPGQGSESINMNAYQDVNGDLVIKGPKEVIAKLNEGQVETESGWNDNEYEISVKEVFYGWNGSIYNCTQLLWGGGEYADIVFEKVDDTTLKVKKQTLIDHGFVDGTYKFNLSVKHNLVDCFESAVVLNLGVKIAPNQEKELELVGKLPKVVVGENTDIASSEYTLKGLSGQKVNSDDFYLYWTEKSEWNGKVVYSRTPDEKFQAGKEYFLGVSYYYVEGGKDEINYKDIKLSGIDLVFENTTEFYGATAGSGLGTNGSASFRCKKAFVAEAKPVVKPNEATINKGDVVKEFTTPTGNFMSFNVTSVEPEANAEVIAKIEARNVTPEVKTIKKDEKSVTFSVKPIDATSATKEELDTKGIWVTFSINVKGIFAEGTKVRVLHYKDGETEACETLEGVVDGSGDIVLSTKKGFSTFTVVEAPKTSNTTSSTKPAGVKDTNGDGVISCDEEMGSKNWIWSETKKACVYKVSNTSVK